MRSAGVLMWGAVAAAVAQLIHAYPRLPESMATHFDAYGAPDGWATKAGYFWAIGSVLALTVACCALLPLLLSRVPADLWSLPKKDAWLEAGSRHELLDVVGGYVMFFGALTVFFVVAVNHLVFRVAFGEATGLGTDFYWLLGGYLVLTGYWAVALGRRLGRGPEGA